MALALLLQPQMLERLGAMDREQAFADDAMALLQRLFAEPANLLTVAGAFEKGFQTAGERLLARIEPRLDQILGSVRDLLAPLLGPLEAIADKASDATSAPDLIAALCDLLDAAAAALGALDEATLREFAGRVDALLSDTLGLSQQFLQDELRQIYATVRAELLAQASTLEPKQAAIALAAVSFLGRVEDEILPQAAKLDLHPDRLAQRLLAQLGDSGFETWRGKLACIVGQLRAILAGGAALFEQAKPSVFGPSSGGAAQVREPLATDQYCWYATRLYADKHRTKLPKPSQSFWPSVGHLALWGITQIPGFPADEVWLSRADGDKPAQLVLRRAFWVDEVLHQAGQDFVWLQAPQFTSASGKETYTFSRLGADFMEQWTRISAGVLELAKTGGHIAGAATEQGLVTNIPLAIWNPVRAASTTFAAAPLPAYVNHKLGWDVAAEGLLFSSIPLLAGLLGKVEDVDDAKKIAALDKLFATSPDIFKTDTDGLLRDLNEGVLAVFTLLNYRGPASAPDGEDTRPLNREGDGPIVGLVGQLVSYLIEAATPASDKVRLHPGEGVFWLYLLLIVPVAQMAGAFVATLICWTLAQAVTGDRLWKNPLKQAGKSAFKFFIGHLSKPEA
jgi:hypothetical protein